MLLCLLPGLEISVGHVLDGVLVGHLPSGNIFHDKRVKIIEITKPALRRVINDIGHYLGLNC